MYNWIVSNKFRAIGQELANLSSLLKVLGRCSFGQLREKRKQNFRQGRGCHGDKSNQKHVEQEMVTIILWPRVFIYRHTLNLLAPGRRLMVTCLVHNTKGSGRKCSWSDWGILLEEHSLLRSQNSLSGNRMFSSVMTRALARTCARLIWSKSSHPVSFRSILTF
jgi:hypothetical protein